jgi:hypothetical protein
LLDTAYVGSTAHAAGRNARATVWAHVVFHAAASTPVDQLRADPRKYVVDATFRRIYTNTTIPVADVIGQPDWTQILEDLRIVFNR